MSSSSSAGEAGSFDLNCAAAAGEARPAPNRVKDGTEAWDSPPETVAKPLDVSCVEGRNTVGELYSSCREAMRGSGGDVEGEMDEVELGQTRYVHPTVEVGDRKRETGGAEDRVEVDKLGEAGDQDEIMVEGVSHIEKKKDSVADTNAPGLVFGDEQAVVDVAGPTGRELGDGLVGDNEPGIDLAESGGTVSAAAGVEVGGAKKEHMEYGRKMQEMPVEIGETDEGSECQEEGASCARKSRGMVDSMTSSTSIVGEQGVEDGSHGDQNSKVDADKDGAMVGTAEAVKGFAKVQTDGSQGMHNIQGPQNEIGEMNDGSKCIKEGVPCVEKNQSTANDVARCELVDGHVGAKERTPCYVDLKVEDESDGEQKQQSDVGNRHVQVKECVMGLSDTDPKQAEVDGEFTAGKEDMGGSLSVEIHQALASTMIGGGTVVGNAVIPETNQAGCHEAAVSHSSLVGENSDAVELCCPVPRRETEVGSMSLDEPVVGEVDLLMKESDLNEKVVEAQNPDSNTTNENLMDEPDFISVESNTTKKSPFAEEGSRHACVVSDDQRGGRGSEKTEVESGKTVFGEESQKLDAHPLGVNVMAGAGSVCSDLLVESKSRDTQQFDENRCDKDDCVTSDACLLVETQGANACQLVETLVDKGDTLMGDDNSVVELTVSKPSELSDLYFVASQGKECADSLPDVSEKPEDQSIASLGDKGHKVEPFISLPEVMAGQSSSQNVNAESRALEEDIYPSEVLCGQEAEVSEELDNNRGTFILADIEASSDMVVEADGNEKVQAGKQELSGRTNEQILKHDGTSTVEDDQRARYYLPHEENDSFSSSDLVWGKVKSHPWWPGQIFDSSHASEMALKHQKKDCFLVAYFGDKTFAWCEETQLKPFQKHFSQMEKQSSSDAFVNAVREVLQDVSRRIELGMTCYCLSEEACADIKYKKVENSGIQEGTLNLFVDRPQIVNGFQPGSLLEFIHSLAQFPTGSADRLDLLIVQAQLKAFYHSKGYPDLPVFLSCGGMVENDVEILPSRAKESDCNVDHSTQTLSIVISENRKKRGRKRKSTKEKHILEDSREQRSLSRLMEEESILHLTNGSMSGSEVEVVGKSTLHSTGKKHLGAGSDSVDVGDGKKRRLDSLGDLETKPPSLTPNGSFRVGEWIRRAASQLTGSPPVLISCGEKFRRRVPKPDHILDDDFGAEASPHTPAERQGRKTIKSEDHDSLNELLSQLYLAARNPMKRHGFVSTIVNFFTNFRKSCSSSSLSSKEKKHVEKLRGKRGRRRIVNSNVVSPDVSSDMSTPDHMKDSYWSDMIFHNCPESNGLKRKGESHPRRQKRRRKHGVELADSLALGPVLETAKPFQLGAPSTNMKQKWLAERPMIILEEKIVDECTPTELVLNFNKSDSIPSKTDLIRIFSRYGPLKEAETEVLRKSNRAKVVFKKHADAEIAFSSAGKFSIFGPALLSYKLRYMPSAPKASLNTTPLSKRDAVPAASENMAAPVQVEMSASAVGDPAQLETIAVAMTEPETGALTVTDPAQAETSTSELRDSAEIKTGAVAMAEQAYSETGALEVADTAHIETRAEAGMEPMAQVGVETLAVPDLAEADSGAVTVVDQAEADSGALTVADQDTRGQAVTGPAAPPETKTLTEVDLGQTESEELTEACAAQAKIGAQVDADPGILPHLLPAFDRSAYDLVQAETGAVEMAETVADPAKAEIGAVAMEVAEPAQEETRELVVTDPTQS